MTIRGNNRLQLRSFSEKSNEYGNRVKRALTFGDSWFRLPMNRLNNYRADVTTALARRFRGTLFLDEGLPGRDSKHWQKALPRIRDAIKTFKFDAILLSTGGNDIVGQELEWVLKPTTERGPDTHAAFGQVPAEVRRYVRLVNFQNRLDKAITDIDVVVRQRQGPSRDAPVFLHTYDYVYPNGKPWRLHFKSLNIYETGPWIAPAFKAIGLDVVNTAEHLRKAKIITDWMLYRFAERLATYASNQRDVHVVRSLGILGGPEEWNDEIHPTREGFQRIADAHWIPALANDLR